MGGTHGVVKNPAAELRVGGGSRTKSPSHWGELVERALISRVGITHLTRTARTDDPFECCALLGSGVHSYSSIVTTIAKKNAARADFLNKIRGY